MKSARPASHHSAIFWPLFLAFVLAAGVCVYRLKQIQSERQRQSEHYDPESAPPGWPCAADAARWCPGMAQDESRMSLCLDEHLAELSTVCSEYRDLYDSPDDWANVCKTELHTICAGRAVACLKENRAALSPRCAGRLARYDRNAQWRGACGNDAARLCAGLADAAAEACVEKNLSDASAPCRLWYRSKP